VEEALRDTTDEEAARHAREQYRSAGIPLMATDAEAAPHLADDERVLGMRAQADLGRLDEATRATVRHSGRLYVTDRRLLHLGEEVVSVSLADIVELAMSDERILVTLAESRGVTLDISDPRRFRVLVAAAKSASNG
jgi:hypothetical protein